MRVLVTGHRGYIGSPLVDRLKTAGHEVVGVDTELYEDCTFGGETRTVASGRSIAISENYHPPISRALMQSPISLVSATIRSEICCRKRHMKSTMRLRYGWPKSPKPSGVRRFVFSSIMQCLRRRRARMDRRKIRTQPDHPLRAFQVEGRG